MAKNTLAQVFCLLLQEERSKKFWRPEIAIWRLKILVQSPVGTNINKRHAMHAEAMTFHKGSLIIFRTFVLVWDPCANRVRLCARIPVHLLFIWISCWVDLISFPSIRFSGSTDRLITRVRLCGIPVHMESDCVGSLYTWSQTVWDPCTRWSQTVWEPYTYWVRLCGIPVHMESDCVGTLYILSQTVWDPCTHGVRLCGTLYILSQTVWDPCTHGVRLCGIPVHMESDCMGSLYTWSQTVWDPCTHGVRLCGIPLYMESDCMGSLYTWSQTVWDPCTHWVRLYGIPVHMESDTLESDCMGSLYTWGQTVWDPCTHSQTWDPCIMDSEWDPCTHGVRLCGIPVYMESDCVGTLYI